jgi:Domain of unknown function (DUF4388)
MEPGSTTFYDRPIHQEAQNMTETNAEEVPTASLVGALAVFPLDDVLGLLADTGQRGELQVVGQGVDGHLWVDSKDLVGSALDGTNSISQAVFQLMLLNEGWFYFTSDQAPPAGQTHRQSVTSVINEVGPQVQEWRDLLTRVPLGAMARMAPVTPGPEVQVRSDQWRVLAALGTTGRSVGSVIDQLEDDSVVTLRLMRELVESGLVVLDRGNEPTPAGGAPPQPAANQDPPPPPPGFVASAPGPSAIPSDPIIGAESMPIAPPPVTADPWAPPGSSPAESSSTYGRL